MTTIAYVVGARPNFMKIAPVYDAVRARMPAASHVLIHTGQHYDDVMSRVFLEQLGLPHPHFILDVGSGPHGLQTARALERMEDVLLEIQPDAIVVPGDVNSTLAAALAAAKLEIPIAHVEAGLRSFDRTMPEEINRVLVDQLATWCLTPSREADKNLISEGVSHDRIFFVGNTMIDTLVRLQHEIAQAAESAPDPPYVVVTLHRPSLVDGPLLADTMNHLEQLAQSYRVLFPVHPRTRARLNGRGYENVEILEPLGYIEFLGLVSRARAVVTDSGGVQEETTFLHVPCFTLRAMTERPVTVTHGTNVVLGLDPAAIRQLPTLLERRAPAIGPPELWDGRAAERIAAVLAGDIDRGAMDG